MNPRETYIHRGFNEMAAVVSLYKGSRLRGCVIGPGCETPLEYDDDSWISSSYQPFVLGALCDYFGVDYSLTVVDRDEEVLEAVVSQSVVTVPRQCSRLTEAAFLAYTDLTDQEQWYWGELWSAPIPVTFNCDTAMKGWYDLVVCTYVGYEGSLPGSYVISDKVIDVKSLDVDELIPRFGLISLYEGPIVL
ncbi:MAG: hypothetical protein ACQESG_06595 [Nanobdellota archaeon]